jgi:diaminohydroxyphosphoribosylaminopyrimidine deaminase/5-amino-6-(5-phosphoribosylamino)uracil reductase
VGADFTDTDASHLGRAIDLAHGSIGLSEPNPRVGCVITQPGQGVVATGFTQEAGGPHAEIVAMRDAQSRGVALAGATVYVSLEPCSHHGRTPPCCDALIAARVARVVVAHEDPFPLVAGRGLAQLRAAGIEVVLCTDDGLVDRARELNIGFLSRVLRRRPWVRLKAAISLDGRTALPDGRSRWITGEAARADGHAWRRRAGAVLTGVGTVVEDDPRLDVRHVATARQPARVVVDSRLEMPVSARLLDPPGTVWIVHALDEAAAAGRGAPLRERGARLVARPGAQGKVDLAAMLDSLAEAGINELHVEAGHRLNGSLVREGLVDEWLVYVAPVLLGEGRALAAFGPLPGLDDAVRFEWRSVERLGADLRLIGRQRGREPWSSQSGSRPT